MLVDWGSWGRAVTQTTTGSIQPIWDQLLAFKNNASSTRENNANGLMSDLDDSANMSSSDRDDSFTQDDNPARARTGNKKCPMLKLFVYSANESVSDELLGEGELEGGDLLQGDVCVVELRDLQGGYAGQIEMSLQT